MDQLSFDFRYPPDCRGRYYLRFKNDENFETKDIPVGDEEQLSGMQTFAFSPLSNDQIASPIEKDGRFLVMNMSIATDFRRYDWYGDASVEIGNLKVKFK